VPAPKRQSLLVGYQYVPALHAYRNLATGRTVARAKIVELLDAQVQARGDRLARLTLDYKDGVLDASTWLATMRDELRRAALENLAIGSGGHDRVSQAGYGRVGQSLREDYRRLIAFADGIADGSLSEAQILNRIALYMGNARTQYWKAQVEFAHPKPGMVLQSRRILHPAEHCPSCVMYSRAGWQPYGRLPVPGTMSECLTHCKCTLETREVPIAEAAALVGSGPLPDWNASEALMGGPTSGNRGHAGRPGKVGGSAKGSAIAPSIRYGAASIGMADFEDRLFGNQEHEELFARLPDGTSVWLVGELDHVHLPADAMERNSWADGVVSHNHPSGNSFSPDDVYAVLKTNVKEIRAVGEKDGVRYLYRLRPNSQIYNRGLEAIKAEIVVLNTRQLDEWQKKISNGSLPIDKANFEHWHTIWTEMDKRYGGGLHYSREVVS